MERSVALKKLGKLLGKSLGYRVNPKAPGRDERAAAQSELKEAQAARNEARAKREERYQAVLAADAEYQRLSAEFKAANAECNRLSEITSSYKITVGLSSGIFFRIEAQGDSWEEVIEEITKRQA